MKHQCISDFYAAVQHPLKLGLLYSIFIAVGGCMKQQCYTCVSTFPLIIKDTTIYRDSLHDYCDITIEKAKHIERTGTFKRDYIVGAETKTLVIETVCTGINNSISHFSFAEVISKDD